MRIIWGILIAGLISTQSYAVMDIEGEVCAYNSQRRLGIRPFGFMECYYTLYLNNVAMNDFKALRTGDYIHFIGTQNPFSETIEIQSIEKVGLKRLLGVWLDGRGRLFDFSSFSQMSRYNPKKTSSRKWEHFEYEIHPNGVREWLLLLVNDSRVYAGKIKEKSANVFDLCIFESKKESSQDDCTILSR